MKRYTRCLTGTKRVLGCGRISRNYLQKSFDHHRSARLQTLVGELDALIPMGQKPDVDQLAAIVDLCAWVHTEWVRIHPFVNGNGRTARFWANSLATRYGVSLFIRLRPRPGAGYGEACASAMQGDWKPTAAVFRRLLDDFLNES